jgi:hypothetical protein
VQILRSSPVFLDPPPIPSLFSKLTAEFTGREIGGESERECHGYFSERDLLLGKDGRVRSDVVEGVLAKLTKVGWVRNRSVGT